MAVKRLDGESEIGDPRYLTLDLPLKNFINPEGNVKLSGLGCAFFDGQVPRKPDMPPELRNPEMLFSNGISRSHDFWALGCLIYYVFTGKYPINLSLIYSDEARNDAHMIQLHSLLGSCPEHLRDQWAHHDECIDQEGKLKDVEVDDGFNFDEDFECLSSQNTHPTKSVTIQPEKHNDTEAVNPTPLRIPDLTTKNADTYPILYPQIVRTIENKLYSINQVETMTLAEYEAMSPSLRELSVREKHRDMYLKEAEMIADLLHKIFTYDPKNRITAQGVLQHPYLQNYCIATDKATRGSKIVNENSSSLKRKRKDSPA